MKETIKNLKTSSGLFIKQSYHVVWSLEKMRVIKANKEIIMLSSKCAVCGSKKSKLIKKQEAEARVNMIGKIPIFVPLLM